MDYSTEIRWAQRIEAGLLAEEALAALAPDGALGPDQSLAPHRDYTTLVQRGATRDELTVLVAEGREATHHLVKAHMGLVGVIAAETARRRRLPYEEVFQEGCVALHEALMRYDWRRGPFAPYAAAWVRVAVRAVRGSAWSLLDDTDIADPRAEQHCEVIVTRGGLAEILNRAPGITADILKRRTGWEDRPLTRREVGRQLGLTVSAVRHLERQGIKHVRQHWQLAECV